MKTPIMDFVRGYAASGTSRFHMPGHKGVPFLGAEPYDITEIYGADVLYSADGIIDESEKNASMLFGTAHTFYSAEGSTLAIKAMLTLAASSVEKDKRAVVWACRNAHKAFIYGAALIDIDVEWIYPEDESHLCACFVSPARLRAKFERAERLPCAFYVTSPDYLGNVADIRALADVCDDFGVPLLVDNAHGAYLGFLSPSSHPIVLGAAACCDSAHKTLPVLTGGAYLHIGKNAPASFCENARHALSLFASTSPSYLILQSLDMCNAYLSDGYREKLGDCVKRIESAKIRLAELGFAPEESEPLKIVLHTAQYGYTGTELGSFLHAHGIEAEFCDDEYLVLMASPENSEKDFARLLSAFAELLPREPLEQKPFVLEKGRQMMSIRMAFFAPSENVPVSECEGRICAFPTVSCPPAIPIAVCGELITSDTATLFARYGMKMISVVKKFQKTY